MCGIAGIISKTNSLSLREKVFAMSQSIKHRGPDGEGFAFFSETKAIPAYSEETPKVNVESKHYLFNPSVAIDNADAACQLAFAHRRLSIIDLTESGHQPMCDTSGDYWITFNGEVYNYIELREELKQKGHHFVTQTDTEVVVAAYKEWGTACLERFNGMFAFALFDRKNNQVFCARDRVGVKPFYFVNTKDVFAFASEYKAFIKSGLIKFEINEKQQFEFLVNAELEQGIYHSNRINHAKEVDESLFKGIHELKPASFLLFNLSSKQLHLKRYYYLNTPVENERSETEIIEQIEQKVINSIRLRLRSDVEIGSCLSGGLDSSIIAGVINHLQPDHPLKLFTAVFPNEKFDESSYAKQVSDFVGGKYFTVSPTADEFFRDIETLNYHQDLPVWSTSTYSQHRVMKLAKDNDIKVVLDGQGADELFGGYAHHYVSLWKQTLGFSTVRDIRESQPTIYKPYQLFFKQIVKDTFNLGYDYSSYFVEEKKKYGKNKHDRFANNLNEQLKQDYFGRLKSFLKCEDRCSMAFGIESRVPFADDVDLVDFAFSVDGRRKIQKGISKYLLREATKKFIPETIYKRRDKVGFESPLNSWLLRYKSEIIGQISSELDFVQMNYLTNNYEKLVRSKPAFLLRLFSLAVWKRVFTHF